MRTADVADTLDMALAVPGCDSATVLHNPTAQQQRPSYIAGELTAYIEARKMRYVRGTPMRPQNQGKIERWHYSQNYAAHTRSAKIQTETLPIEVLVLEDSRACCHRFPHFDVIAFVGRASLKSMFANCHGLP